MIPILELTTSNAVRAILGVDEEELPDQVFLSLNLEDLLYVDIAGWLPAGSSLDSFVRDGVDAARGTEARLIWVRLSAYSQAFCAHFLLIGQSNWRLIRLTDGNVDERRAEQQGLDDMRRRLEGLMGLHREGLLELLSADLSTSGFSLIGISSPTSDPVTNS